MIPQGATIGLICICLQTAIEIYILFLRIGLHSVSDPTLIHFQIGVESLLVFGQPVQIDLLGRVVSILHCRPLRHAPLPFLDVGKFFDLDAGECCF